ncbi:MAG: esterase/lipase family protein [Candidatus Binatales bacterium]
MGLGSLLGEFRAVRELATFVTDTILNPDSRERLHLPETGATPAGVLLIPGLMASDVTLYPLARRLRQRGHQVFFAGIWCNADCPVRTVAYLEQALRDAADVASGKVIVIGHSLGGVYARELGKIFPEVVERAILLGAPLKAPVDSVNQPLRALVDMMLSLHKSCLNEFDGLFHEVVRGLPPVPPEVPETIVYTRSDGIVDWQSCLEVGPNVEAVEVAGSHCGLAMSMEVWNVIKNRLGRVSAPQRPETRARDTILRQPSSLKLPTRLRPPYLRLVKRPSSAA